MDKIGLALGHDSQYLTVTTGLNGKDILFSSPKAIASLAADGNHWLKRGADGLPYGPATKILETDSLLWIGTPKGLIRKGKTGGITPVKDGYLMTKSTTFSLLSQEKYGWQRPMASPK
ncbi:hypothetical protein ADICYQ_1197 [Cyclobacterium qasimii M12-11B]|uniref:Uncharacterized protein n=2 Tax=Cyclobacterium qasimii TaxID=1350429 RepID=S7X141_9BACT|nr:hypothetical protein ADICYQ_1197 [Cyclobacterium qasimii M12-11B]